jgi:hypothetical protein
MAAVSVLYPLKSKSIKSANNMKTIQLELSESIYDRVISFLELLPKNECHILENVNNQRQTLKEALDSAVSTNAFADIIDPVEIRSDTVKSQRPIGLAKDKSQPLLDEFFLSMEIIEKPRTLLELMGTAKGCFRNAEEVDTFIRAERDAWED